MEVSLFTLQSKRNNENRRRKRSSLPWFPLALESKAKRETNRQQKQHKRHGNPNDKVARRGNNNNERTVDQISATTTRTISPSAPAKCLSVYGTNYREIHFWNWHFSTKKMGGKKKTALSSRLHLATGHKRLITLSRCSSKTFTPSWLSWCHNYI